MLKKNSGFYKKRIVTSFFIFIFCFSFLINARGVSAGGWIDPMAITQRIMMMSQEEFQIFLKKAQLEEILTVIWYSKYLE